jgi:adenylate kinase family enzyme
MQKTVIIISGKSGTGKSSLAAFIQGLDEKVRICCADDFFMIDGEYKFDAAKLGQAHKSCWDKFEQALADGCDCLITNTSTTTAERKKYLNRAKECGFIAFSITLESLGYKDVHNVPPEVLIRQESNLRASFKF